MASRGEYQKQLAALVAKANADKLQFDDILPDELKEHFLEMSELRQAREYVKELEQREQELLKEQDNLKNNLAETKKEIDNLPTEHEARLMELHQARRQIALYKETSEDLSKRAERYRQQLAETVGRKQADASAADRIEDLQIQILDQQAVIDKLFNDNRKSEAMFQQLRESDLKALEYKDKQSAKQDEMLAELRRQIMDAEARDTQRKDSCVESLYNDTDTGTLVDGMPDDSVAVHEQNIDLLQQNLSLSQENEALETRYITVMTKLSELTATYECTESPRNQLFAGAISEIKTLNRFYTTAFSILNNFAKAFHAETADIPSLAYTEVQLDAAQDALAGYNSVKQVVRAVTDASITDPEQVALYNELDSLGASAAESMISLEMLESGFWRFLHQLSDDPKLLSHLNSVLCDAGGLPVVEIRGCEYLE